MIYIKRKKEKIDESAITKSYILEYQGVQCLIKTRKSSGLGRETKTSFDFGTGEPFEDAGYVVATSPRQFWGSGVQVEVLALARGQASHALAAESETDLDGLT